MEQKKNRPPWRFGTIDGTDYAEAAKQGKARVRLADKNPAILTKPLQVAFPFAGKDQAYFMPKIGDRVFVLMDEQGADGVILGAAYTKQSPPPVTSPNKHHIAWDDDTYVEYDKSAHKLIVDVSAGETAIELRGDGVVKILAKGSGKQIIIESEGKMAIAAKQDLELWSDANIKLDALGTITQIDQTTPNPRAPYFPGQSDSYLS